MSQLRNSTFKKPAVELLEDRLVLDAWGLNLDFGTSNSPTAAGYQQVLLKKFDPSVGYGWSDTSELSAVDRSFENTSLVDKAFHTGRRGTFMVNVPNGEYQVTVRMGDPAGSTGGVAGVLENRYLFSNTGTYQGQLLEQSLKVKVTDNQLTLLLLSRGGTNPVFALNSMRIVSTSQPQPPSNQAPSNLALSGNSLVENRPAGTLVGSFSTTDPNLGDTHTYSFVTGNGSTDNSLFTISGNQLTANGAFDFEMKSSYTIRVKTTDAGGLSFEKAFTINVQNANEAPTSIAISNNVFPKSMRVGTLVGLFSTSDPDQVDTWRYTLVSGTGSTDNYRFVIQGNSLKTATALSAGAYSVRIRSTDAGGLSTEQTFSITVNGGGVTNQQPTDLTLSGTSILENRPVGTVVGALSTTDPNVGDSFTYSLVDGAGSTDNGLFTIVGNQLQANSVFNFEAQSTRSVRIKTTDAGGLSFEKAYTVNVQNVNEAPTSLFLSNNRVPEDAPAGTFVGQLSSTDPDQSDTFTYSLVTGTGSTNNANFVIQGNTLKASTALPKGNYSIRVRTTDAGGLFTEQALTIYAAGTANNTLVVTPDFIQTPYLKMPNFGGHPTLVSVQSGNWSDPATWGGRLPQQGDIVSITSGVTVTFDVSSTTMFDVVAVQAGGKLVFRTDIATKLRVSTLLVMEGGELTVGTVAAPVAANVTAQILFPDIPIDTSVDPEQYGHGLIAFGKVTMNGSARPSTFIRLAQAPAAGATTIQLSSPAVGWNVGDKLAVPDTHQLNWWESQSVYQNYVPQWEMPSITGISPDGKTISLSAPLQFNHEGNAEFLPHVAVITRNVQVKSENSLGNRGYALFTQRAEVDVRYVQFAGLGRTTKEVFDNTAYDASGVVTHVGANQQGRYPVNFFHLMGPTQAAGQYQYRFEGNSVVCMMNPFTFRWGVDINDSHYGLINNNVVYNWAGSGISVENGNETGNVFSNNYVSRVFGNGERNNDGLDGTGYWFRGPNSIVRDNVATNVRGAGPYSYGFSITPRYLGTVATPAFPGADLSLPGQTTPIDMNAVSLPEFARNEVYGASYNGLTTWWLGTEEWQPHGTAGVIKDFHVWNVNQWGYFGYASNGLTIDGWVQRGDTTNIDPTNYAQIGLLFSDYFQGSITIKNFDIRGVNSGIIVPTVTSGTTTIKDGYLKNQNNISVSMLWAVSGGEGIPPRKTIIDNVRFDRLAPKGLEPTHDIGLYYNETGGATLIQSDQVFVYNYNGVAGDNFRVYYNEQRADFIVPQTGSNLANQPGAHAVVGSPVAGLTNLQNWLLYGIAVAGEIAPANATTRANIFGLTSPLL